MAYTTVLNRNSYPVGRHAFGPVNLPVGVETIRARMTRYEKLGNGNKKNGTEWPDVKDAIGNSQDVIHFGMDISYDGGSTWHFLSGGTARGGVIRTSPSPTDPEQELEYTAIQASGVPQPDNPNRQIRGFLTTYTNLSTLVQVELA